ncbi:hypothetical protein BWI17_03750 [Betaproteobacteria bacterium GR16-43]|nr:hypothetical protein BWI17_03750 [Betaproteobacteria bacterium GR16-43]
MTSDESDKPALHKHAEKLDKLAGSAKIGSFTNLLDFTDVKFNTTDADLPEGMESTDELMARDGVWVASADALGVLNGLLKVIIADKPRFGLVKNDYEDVVSELCESIEFAKKAEAAGAKFNFSVVM